MSSFLHSILSYRVFVLLISLAILGFGVNSYKKLPIDAFPDISPVQVKIILKSIGMTPQEMESKVITPIEMELLGLANQTMLRSVAKYGICDITIDFKDDTDIYLARQQVNEKLSAILKELPPNIEGGIAPISTPLSDILMFSIESSSLDLTQKRTLLDWVIAPKLRTISGVAEVNVMGGEVKTYEVAPKLDAMQKYGITLQQLSNALEKNNINEGVGRLTQGSNSIFIRSVGSLNDLDDIKNVIASNIDGQNIYVKDIATVAIGHLPKAGFSTKDGKKESVQGTILALKGSNTIDILTKAKEELSKIESNLEGDTKIEIFYDRSNLIDLAIKTLKDSLLEASILIVVVLLLLLGNFASALSVAIILPFALLMSFIAMDFFHLSANLMSLGGLAIAIGILVDSAIVMVEHISSHLGSHKGSKLDIILKAASEVAPSIITGVLIIIIVFLPLLTLEGLEGKLFKPVALSIVFALSSSLILSLTLIPAISSYILKTHDDKESLIVKSLLRVYLPSLEFAIKHSKVVLTFVIVLFLFSLYLANKTGKIFMPTMQEGEIVAMIETLPSISIEESVKLNKKIQSTLLNDVPQIKSIIARTGTDEIGLDPMSLNDSDTFIILKPKSEWGGASKDEIKNSIKESLESLGVEYMFSQPIEMRVSEMLTGVRGDLAIDIFGLDNATLEKIALDIKKLLEQIKGSSEVYKKNNEGVEYLELSFKNDALGYYKVSKEDIAIFLKSLISGVEVGTIQEGLRRIKLMIKSNITSSLQELKDINYLLEDGSSIPLSYLVEFKSTTGPVQIEHENGFRKTVVQSNVVGRDLVSFVDEAKELIEKNIALPEGYYITYGGEFENQQRSATRLAFIVPIAIALIFLLLFVSFNSIKQALLVLINIPFALIGGFMGLYISGEYMSVPASVGFIALLGIAILNGVVLVNYFNTLLKRGHTLLESIKLGSIRRFRPVIMTATITAFGLLPLLFASGVGSEIQKPLAIVVIGGLVSSTALTLIVLPILYLKVMTKGE